MKRKTIGVAVLFAVAAATATNAQAPTPPSAGIMTARMAAGAMKSWLTKAAEGMNEEDYAFKPTPDVRSFGQLMAHVADQDYEFCAAAKGEPQPVHDIEKTRTTKAEIVRAVTEAIAYCDGVYSALTEVQANTLVKLRGRPLPALSVLLFRTHHSSLHYGNAITYMRLRGRIPPSSALP